MEIIHKNHLRVRLSTLGSVTKERENSAVRCRLWLKDGTLIKLIWSERDHAGVRSKEISCRSTLPLKSGHEFSYRIWV